MNELKIFKTICDAISIDIVLIATDSDSHRSRGSCRIERGRTNLILKRIDSKSGSKDNLSINNRDMRGRRRRNDLESGRSKERVV